VTSLLAKHNAKSWKDSSCVELINHVSSKGLGY